MKFSDVVEISAQRFDKFTYEEVHLFLRNDKGVWISFGELDEGFADLVAALETLTGGLPESWHARVDTETYDAELLWQRPAATPEESKT